MLQLKILVVLDGEMPKYLMTWEMNLLENLLCMLERKPCTSIQESGMYHDLK